MSSPDVLLAGRYRLDSRIASGGVGEVWRAADLVLGRTVAVKLLQDSYAGHQETLARFRAEARHAGSLSHPGIARVYDYGEADPPGPPYLVLELVDGPSLAGVLASGPLDPARVMDVLAQAAAGLAAAHAAGLVHRDIKPANLLMGPGGTVKITDFGIAHAAGSAPITRVGMLVGTPAYLAPERVTGALATPASDLYSLGIVAYECLAGTPPFRGTPQEITAACQHRPLPPLPASVPSGVAALVAELTAKDPAARPASAGDVARRAGRLRDALTGASAGGAMRNPAGGAAVPLAARPDSLPLTRADAQPVTLAEHRAVFAGVPGRGLPPRRGRQRRGSGWPGRRVGLAVAAALVVGLAGWLVAGVPGAVPPRPHLAGTSPPAPASRATSAGVPATRMVGVNGAALAGQPVGVVIQQLNRLDLRPRLADVITGQQPPGTVVSVQPSGQVPVGSIVTVITAVAPPGHQHGHGGGGNGNGDG
ncbi:MAG TPA: protein kinase [Streptosporangiaceae bacterium]|nr:protein kinase [Streptosporangiaceae bacterium]